MPGRDSKIRRFRALQDLTGGEGGIRTHDTLARIPVFETGTFNRSVTSPVGRDFTSAEDQRAGSMALSPPIYSCNATGMSTPPSAR